MNKKKKFLSRVILCFWPHFDNDHCGLLGGESKLALEKLGSMPILHLQQGSVMWCDVSQLEPKTFEGRGEVAGWSATKPWHHPQRSLRCANAVRAPFTIYHCLNWKCIISQGGLKAVTWQGRGGEVANRTNLSHIKIPNLLVLHRWATMTTSPWMDIHSDLSLENDCTEERCSHQNSTVIFICLL